MSERFRVLRIGPLSFALDGADLRYVRFGETEIIRRLYIGVRSETWGTLSPELAPTIVTEDDDRILIQLAGHHAEGAIVLDWTAAIEAHASGSLRYRLEATAETAFDYNRIGLCVLHPIAGVAGQPVHWTDTDGVHEGGLPELIGPQEVIDGTPQPLIGPFSQLELEQAGLGTLRLRFEGDLFELEDQRNWTDASFKTYSTPLSLGVPHHAEPGDPIVQQVEVAPAWEVGPPPAPATRATVTVGEPVGTLPPIGLRLPAPGTAEEHDRFRLFELRPSHLRIDLRAGDVGSIRPAEVLAIETGARLEVALRIAEGETFDEVIAALSHLDPPPVRVVLLPIDDSATPGSVEGTLVPVLRRALPAVRLIGGTGSHFVALNNAPLDLGSLDGVAYGVNPQGHASDEASIMETPEAQGDTVRTAQALTGGLPVSVGPIELGQDDQRQASSFAAAWALATVNAFAQAGAASLTIFDATGPGSTGDARGRFPVHLVLAALARHVGETVLAVELAEPFTLSALATRNQEGAHLVLANPQNTDAEVTVEWPGGWREVVQLAAGDMIELAHEETP